MRIQPSTGAVIAVLALATACTSPPTQPPDTRPLGDVTATPRECDLISANAIKLATGFKDYTAVGTKMDKGRFASCSVAEDLTPEGKLGLVIEIFDPSPHDAEDLENTKLSTQGNDLPAEVGPGFAAWRRNAEDQSIAFVYGWTPDYKRLLTINIYSGAPGRDSLSDATEFFRQLKPVLLDKPK
ncbi:hypothetical protein EDD27_5439 [Nonomuraea polychroma]|uniref:DUF3558 domain-containing protein n=1 Tax=Nonomuraea polychroma TaxID=46176 RepID=A0A438MAP3_9ACTN|nr:hypothetical protein [Nonomuraea polychroma]RVX42776.1 hypothetical protein EDD27_5439 [Nonomuraea polychroma]